MTTVHLKPNQYGVLQNAAIIEMKHERIELTIKYGSVEIEGKIKWGAAISFSLPLEGHCEPLMMESMVYDKKEDAVLAAKHKIWKHLQHHEYANKISELLLEPQEANQLELF